MTRMFPFQVVYRNATQVAHLLDDERLLALIRFRAPAAPVEDPRSGTVPLPELGGTATTEVWLSAGRCAPGSPTA